jgi:hypothetical protein
MVLAWAIRLQRTPAQGSPLPGTDDTEAVMEFLSIWHRARKVTTERLHS